MSQDIDLNSLKKKSATAVAWDLFGTYSQQGIGFIISIFLARLLTPAEFGTVGIALVFIAIFQVFTDFGFASALIQNKVNSSLSYSSVFYLNIFAGILLFLLVFFSAPFFAHFYGNPVIKDLLRLLSLNFVFGSLNIVQRTILRKNIAFRKLTVRSVVSQGLSGCVAVILAFNGFGVYAIVIQSILANLINTVILWRVTQWRPKLEFSWQEIKNLSGFSIYRFFDSSLSAISLRIDSLAIGKFFSADVLGYYSRAESVNSLVVKNSSATATRVFYSVLSKLNGSAAFISWYKVILTLICTLSFFLMGCLFIMAEDLILVLFGQKWAPSVPIFEILVFKAFTYPLNAYLASASVSTGASRETFRVGTFRSLFRLLPLLFAYYFGLQIFLLAYVAVNYIITFVNIVYLSKPIGFSAKNHFRVVLSAAVPTILLIAMSLFFDVQNYLPNYALLGVFVAAYTMYTALFQRSVIVTGLNFARIITSRDGYNHQVV